MTWYKRNPIEFINATHGANLSLEDVGALALIIDLYATHKRALKDNDASNAAWLRVTKRKWESIKARLTNAEVISIIEGRVVPTIFEQEISDSFALSAKNAENGRKSAESRRQTTAESDSNDGQTSGHYSAKSMAYVERSFGTDKIREEEIRGEEIRKEEKREDKKLAALGVSDSAACKSDHVIQPTGEWWSPGNFDERDAPFAMPAPTQPPPPSQPEPGQPEPEPVKPGRQWPEPEKFDSARFAKENMEVLANIMDKAGVTHNERRGWIASEIAKWRFHMNADPEIDIIPTIFAILERREQRSLEPPKYLSYFTEAVREAVATRLRGGKTLKTDIFRFNDGSTIPLSQVSDYQAEKWKIIDEIWPPLTREELGDEAGMRLTIKQTRELVDSYKARGRNQPRPSARTEKLPKALVDKLEPENRDNLYALGLVAEEKAA